MVERGIAEREVEETIRNPDILKRSRSGALHAASVWRKKFLNVIFIKLEGHVVVITVYPSERVMI
jgi:hypothetical protein